MALGQIGPFTALLESVATAVGAGMLLGGFALGSAAFVVGSARPELAERALTDGYLGGFVALGLILLDTVLC